MKMCGWNLGRTETSVNYSAPPVGWHPWGVDYTGPRMGAFVSPVQVKCILALEVESVSAWGVGIGDCSDPFAPVIL